jgi:hypothetical protein
MPQPISNYVRDPYLTLETDGLAKLPNMAILVAEIFAQWASIERELGVLLVRLLGADAAPAHAIFGILLTQSLQTKALEAAARSSLSAEHFEAFTAVMTVIDGVKKTRNKLAHWAWAKCKQRPDLLVLADPDFIKEHDSNAIAFFQRFDPNEAYFKEHWAKIQFDPSAFYAYTEKDLEREVRDLKQAGRVLLMFGMLLDPSIALVNAKSVGLPEDREVLRGLVLQELNGEPLFREAVARTNASRKSTPPPPDGSNPQAPVG